MDSFPREILHKIFIQLDLQQQLECLLVCRCWWNALDKYSLFYSVQLKNPDYFNKWITLFEQSPGYAARVEELEMVNMPDTGFDRRTLLNLFPNARVIKMSPNWGLIDSDSSPTTPIELTHSKAKLEHLSDFIHCDLVAQLLYSNLGDRLETLFLNFHDVTSVRLGQLKDLPVLKRLALQYPIFEIVDLEELHKNVPSIEELALENISVEDGRKPSDIIPAASIKKVKLNDGYFKDKDVHIQFYQYATRKYSNMAVSEYGLDDLCRYSNFHRREIYVFGLFNFYKLIGTKQYELSISALPNQINPFSALDAVDAKMKAFSFYECESTMLLRRLARSNQASHVEKIEYVGFGLALISYIKKMTALTTLSLTLHGNQVPPISLDHCLEICPPSLKHFTFRNPTMDIVPSTIQFESIETLEIETNPLSSVLGDTVSSCFPNLVTLKLRGIMSESLSITLKQSHFRTATFYLRHAFVENPGFGFAFTSPNCTKSQYYLFRGGKGTDVQRENIKDLPTLSFESVTDNRLEIEELWIHILPC
jgi:hypothetical protein